MKEMRTRVFLVVGFSLIAFVIAELLCRVFIPAQPPLRFEEDIHELRLLKLDALVGTLQEDPALFWRFKPRQVLPEHFWPFGGLISNAQGLREDHVIRPEPGQKRILMLGDSRTFGYGLPFNRSYVQLAEERINAGARHGERWECINAGVPGYSLWQGWRYLEKHASRLNPDVVVVAFGWNDTAVWDNLGDFEHAALLEASTPPDWLAWSRLAAVAKRSLAVRESTPAPGPPRPRLTPEEYRSVLELMDTYCDSHGIRLVLMILPMQADFAPKNRGLRTPLQQVTARYAREHNLSLVDLVTLAQSIQPVPDDLFIDVGHGTARMQELVADELVRVLTLP